MQLNRERFLENNTIEFKYKSFIIISIVIHSIILIFSLCTGVMPLVFLNIGSVLVYLLCMALIKRRPSLILYMGFLEIIVHSFVTVIFIGNDYGFALYFIAVIPISFHLLNATNTKNYLLKATILSTIAFLFFIICYIISILHTEYYVSEVFQYLKPYIYLANMLIVFLVLLFSSLLFYAEIKRIHKQLYDKNEELATLANTDPLTGLYNRRIMTIHVQNMYEDFHLTNKPFSLILCDLDDFKKINDTYGHEYGDEILVSISTILSSLTRGLDFVCRWGGEEFVVFLRNIDMEEAYIVAERIRTKVEQTEMKIGEDLVRVTMTFGVSCSTETDDYEKLFELADARMYEGKRSGKNRVV